MRVIHLLAAILWLAGCPCGTAAPDASVDLREKDTYGEGLVGDATGPDGAPEGMDSYPGWLEAARCGRAAPADAPPPAPLKAYSAGHCPRIQVGRNTITSRGAQREFLMVVPANPRPEERFPTIFLWHWLKGGADSFLSEGDVQAAADIYRFIAVIPESKGDLRFITHNISIPWPFLAINSERRYQEEYAFFDDMLSCVAEQFPIDRNCVSSVGVSAGALFGSHLAMARSEYLASALSLSGGVFAPSGVSAVLRPLSPAARKLPMLVLWGGPADSCLLLNFEQASVALEDVLEDGGHFFVECIHNCRHGVPPFADKQTAFGPMWRFVLDHPFWLPEGLSPYLVDGHPQNGLPWCGIGKGGAAVRMDPSCGKLGCPL